MIDGTLGFPRIMEPFSDTSEIGSSLRKKASLEVDAGGSAGSGNEIVMESRTIIVIIYFRESKYEGAYGRAQ